MSSNQRTAARAPLELPVAVEADAGAEGEAPGASAPPPDAREQVRLRNLSSSGVFVTSPTPLPVGTRVRIDLGLEEHAPPTRVDGEVVWVRTESPLPSKEPGMGIRFVAPDPDAKRELRRKVGDTMLKGLADLLYDRLHREPVAAHEEPAEETDPAGEDVAPC